ncbi:MAG: hypothetical protein ACYTGX_04115 [Planctomycetota bacterium]|jgi:hypothetical protein
MRLITLILATIACAFGLTLTGCAPSDAADGVQSGVTTSAGAAADAKSDCADCAGCADKAACADKTACADKADCDGCLDKAPKSGSVYPADSAPATDVPTGSSSAPDAAGGS